MRDPSFLELIGFGPEGWGAALMMATGMTLAVAMGGFAAGSIIGAGVAGAKLSRNAALRAFGDGYTTVLRGIPDLLVIYLFYFGGSAVVSAIGHLFGAEGFVSFPGFIAGALAVGVTSGAQQTEVFRGAFRAVHPGELEAATACGMGRALKFRRVTAPLTLRHALPGLGNVWQVVLKESALVSVTGVVELLRQAQIGAGSTSLPFDFYLIAALIYLAISTISGLLLHASERRFSRGVRRG